MSPSFSMNDEFLQKWKSQIKRGTLAFIVLNELKKKELYGYELIENIRQRTSIAVAEGTLYPLLNRLKKESLVDSKWVEQPSGIPRKYYFLSAEGKEMLGKMQSYWEELEQSIKNYQYEFPKN